MPNRWPPISSTTPFRSPAIVLACLLVIAPAVQAQEPSSAAQSAVAGARVFGEQGCGTCHSVSGLGGSIGPDLRELSSRSDVYGITAALWNHLPEMALRMDSLAIHRPALSAREAGDLLAYLYMIGGGTGVGSPEAGAELFRESACIRCHRVGTAGGVVGPALDRIPSLRSPHGLAAGLWNHSGSMIPMMREMGIPYPTLTAGDMSNLEAFLIASAPEQEPVNDADSWVLPGDAARGRALVEREGCASCHLIAGRGAGTAPDLAVPGARKTVDEYLAALWNKGPAMRAAFAARGAEPPGLDPGEMADVTAYLQSLGYFAASGNVDRGRQVVVSGGCLVCHGWSDDGRVAGDLADLPPNPETANRVAKLWNHLSVIDPDDLVREDWSRLDRNEMIDLLEFLRTGSR